MARSTVIAAGAAVLLLVGAHLFGLGFAAKHLAIPVFLTIGIAALAVVKHLSLMASLAAWFRRRRRGP